MSGFPVTGNREGLRDFSRLALEMLTPFADDVLLALANPRTGILKIAKFLPTLAELSEWCERERLRLFAESAAQDRLDRLAAHRALPPPSVDEIQRKARLDEVMKTRMQGLSAELATKAGVFTKRTVTPAEREEACSPHTRG